MRMALSVRVRIAGDALSAADYQSPCAGGKLRVDTVLSPSLAQAAIQTLVWTLSVMMSLVRVR